LTEVVELDVGNGYLHALVLREVRLEFVLLLFLARVLLLLLVVEAGAELPDEEVHAA
jgi:H+/Cl- antiporter ClcA